MPFAAGFTNKFSMLNATKNFLVSGWNSHSGLLPDSCVSHVIVHTPNFSVFFEKYSTHISCQFFIEIPKFSQPCKKFWNSLAKSAILSALRFDK
jgi:hypothetical protein